MKKERRKQLKQLQKKLSYSFKKISILNQAFIHKSFANENPELAGIYSLRNGENRIKNISFNYDRSESDLSYVAMVDFEEISKNSSIASLFETLEKDSKVTELWKWFITLALAFMLIEASIQKFLK